MNNSKLILITNPGSSSRKYALYKDRNLLCSLHFEFEGKDIIYTIKKADGTATKHKTEMKVLTETVGNLKEILTKEGFLSEGVKLDAVLARAVAPGEYFANDHIVDEECLRQFELGLAKAPLHLPVVFGEIKHFMKAFDGISVLAITDSGFHKDRPKVSRYYGFDTELADKFEIRRFGYHGLSMGSVVEYLKSKEMLPEKLIICHLGSGSSVAAVHNGKSIDTSTGYSPLEGLMMSTRTGDMDVAAALAIKRALGIKDDGELETYLNKQAGLLGVSGSTDDTREILAKRDAGDERAAFANALFVYKVQAMIGRMVAALGGVDTIVFTATVGERSADVRRAVLAKLGYLGFELDESKNLTDFEGRHCDIGTKNSKPILVIKTDEFEEMIRRAMVLLEKE